MNVLEFNIDQGIYNFELEKVETEFHSHPAIEILFCSNGKLNIETSDKLFNNIRFAIIDSNIKHKISVNEGSVYVLMLECDIEYLSGKLLELNINLTKGIYIDSSLLKSHTIINEFHSFYSKTKKVKVQDSRVTKCLEYLNDPSSDYLEMMNILKIKTNLSKSRLSHIFKNEMGISIKKHLVWSRLKKTFKIVLEGDYTMYEASLQTGFYDQAHLSKAFKQMLGLKPSEVYNSRTLQG